MKTLKTLLLSGSGYFTLVAIVHFFQIKIPMLFIYYDIPSYAYQNRIISVLCFSFAVFLFAGFKVYEQNKAILNYILIAGAVSIIGLLINNYISGEELRTNIIYWIEIGVLGVYLILLFIFYLKDNN